MQYMAASHHAKRQLASAAAVWLADSRTDQVVSPCRIGLAKDPERFPTEPVGTHLALDGVRLAALANHEIYFAPRLIPPKEQSLTAC